MRKRSDRQPTKNKRFSGYLGIRTNGANTVEVTGHPGFVWVRLRNVNNEVIQAFNQTTSPIYNLPVLVERDLDSPTRYRIVGRDIDVYGSNWGTASPYLAPHGSQHSWNNNDPNIGGDVTWVYQQQFTPLMVMPSGSAGAGNVLIGAGINHYGNIFSYVGSTGTGDLLAYKPTGSTANLLLVYLDHETGNFGVAEGTPIANTVTGTYDVVANLPAPPTGTVPLAGIRLVSGTSSVGWRNIYDVRPFFVAQTTVVGGGGGGGAPTDASYVTLGLDGDLSAERVLTAGADITITDSGANDNVTVAVASGTFARPGIPIYDNNVWKVTGTIFVFNDNLYVSATGTYAYIQTSGSFINPEYRHEVSTVQPGTTLNLINTSITVTDNALNNSFPSIIKMSNGNLLTVYRAGVGHSGDKGSIKSKISTDNGDTWGAEANVYTDATYDSRDPSLTLLDSGRIWLVFFLSDASTSAHIADGVRIIYSDDNGSTWSGATTINSAFTGDCASNGPMLRYTSGKLAIPLYGKNSGDTYYSSSIIFSNDGGSTWGNEVVIADGEDDSRMYAEPNLTYLDFYGIILCMMRSDTPDAANGNFFASYSNDQGNTWSVPVSKFSATGAPRVHQLKNHILLIIYRNNADVTQAIYRISRNNGFSWSDSSLLDDTSAVQMTYAETIEYDEGVLGVILGTENNLAGDSNIVFYRMYTTWEAGQLHSNVPSGTAPLAVNSQTLVTNLNADTLDGYHASDIISEAGGCGTYQRVGEPEPLNGVDGLFWRVPNRVFASGSLAVFQDGSILRIGYDFEEQLWVSGTYKYMSAPATGTIHMVMYGVPCTTQTQPPTGTPVDGLLTEYSNYLLLENNDKILLEN